ncbi:MAG TPA: Na+/H+ antiporter subunit E [Burkholderiales bacterium]|nr:Na+/H+ antiporter subunit E [Burkholderiales bacterium]
MNFLPAYPLLAASLFAMWLLLNGSLAPGHLLLGAVFGLTGSWILGKLQAPLHPPRSNLRRARAIAELFWLVLEDIVRSNLAVARLVLYRRSVRRVAGFIHMPLVVRHPGSLAVLAMIITATPGTSWARYDAERNVITIHVFDLIDEQGWITTFKDRYETRLMEILE